MSLPMDPALLVAIAVVIVTTAAIVMMLRGRRSIALSPEEYREFKLQERWEVSHDTRKFRFALQSPTTVLGLPIGQHISLKFTDEEGKAVTRSYTPTSSDDDLGYVDFVIKVYHPNVHPKFPAGGKMSFYLEGLKVGQPMLMRGPKGNLTYRGKGLFDIARRGQRRVKKIGMMCGGTGITPMTQIVTAVVKEGGDIEMSLIFANQTEEDILLRDMIEGLAKTYPKFKFHYTLDRPSPEWRYSAGFIDEAMVKKHLPPPGDDTIVLMCGPPPMIKFACVPALEKLGYSKESYFDF